MQVALIRYPAMAMWFGCRFFRKVKGSGGGSGMSDFFLVDPVIENRSGLMDGKAAPEVRIDVSVECESGYDGEETPCCFLLCTRPRQVTEVLDRWLAGDFRNFKVKGDDGGLYVLRHVMTVDRWELTLYAGGEC